MGSNDHSLSIVSLNKKCWTHPSPGGAETNLRETLTRLSERGHNVQLLTRRYEGSSITDTDGGVKIRRVGPEWTLTRPWDDFLSYITITCYFYYYIATHQPDIIYKVESPLPWIIFTRIPTVSLFHHLALDSLFETHSFPVNWIGYYLEKLSVLLLGDSLAIGVSQATVNEIAKIGHPPERIAEINNGIDTGEYGPKPTNAPPQISFLGGLEMHKGADRIPEIHKNVEEQTKFPVQLNVVGRTGAVADDIIEYCDNTSTADYYGFVSEEKKLKILQDSWVLIVPSRVEGWGIAVIEANACGTPAVANKVGGLEQSVNDGETGLLVERYSPCVFANHITNILNNDTFREKLSENAHSWAKKHSWENNVDKLESILVEEIR